MDGTLGWTENQPFVSYFRRDTIGGFHIYVGFKVKNR